MLEKIHQDFQIFLDQIIESPLSVENKIDTLKTHLLSHQTLYEELLFSCFNQEELEPDQYFYITYTYQDRPIHQEDPNEFVVSMLYDIKNGFYFEISVFNYFNQGKEKTLTFNRTSSFLN